MRFYADQARQFREEARLTQEDVGNACGVTPQAVGFWERGENNPLPGKVRQMAKLYKCLVSDISDLKPGKRQNLQAVIDATGSASAARGPWRTCGLYGLALCADRGLYVGDVSPDHDSEVPQVPVPIEIDDVKRPSAFRALDGSMVPTVCEGDLIFFDPDTEIRDGDVVLVKYEDDNVVCKRWRPDREGRRILLLSDAPGVAPLTLQEYDIRWKYRVCFIQPQGRRL